MKNFIINIYKTLFFFDFAVIVVYFIHDIKTENTAFLQLWRESVYFLTLLLFTAFFFILIEHRKLKIPIFKDKFRNYSVGLINAVIITVIPLAILKIFGFLNINGTNSIKHIIIWFIAVLLNSAATELLIHGYLFSLYRKYYSLTFTVTVTTLLYLSLNINIFKEGIIYAANMILFNILLSLLIEYHHSVLAAITLRFLYTAVTTLVISSHKLTEDYPNIFNVSFSGNTYISGGINGISGSVILFGMLVFLLIFYTVKLRKKSK